MGREACGACCGAVIPKVGSQDQRPDISVGGNRWETDEPQLVF